MVRLSVESRYALFAEVPNQVQSNTVSGAQMSRLRRLEFPGAVMTVPPHFCFVRAAPGTGALHQFGVRTDKVLLYTWGNEQPQTNLTWEASWASNRPVNFVKDTLMFITQGARQNRLHGFWRAFAARLLPLLLLLALPAGVQAQFIFTTNNDGSLNISKYTGGGAVIIPSTTNGLQVSSIGTNAFSGCTSLTGVTISSNVTSIGGSAFVECYSLTNVTIGNSVSSIGEQAFCNCFDLPSITIPNSVTNIGCGAFYCCTSLTNAMIGNGVSGIGDKAFFGCNLLASVKIPNSVTSIGTNVFLPCVSLTAIIVDASNSVYCSVDGVLFNKGRTKIIQYPGGKAGSDYTIPNSVSSIGDYAFYGSTNPTNVAIPNSVTSIGSWVFYGCTSLTNVTIPDSVTSIGSYAFYGCFSLTSVTIGNVVTNIGSYAFASCYSLTGAYFKGNAPSVDLIGLDVSYVFGGDYNATAYYLPGMTGWGSMFGGIATAFWFLPNPLILNNSPRFGVQTDRFGFIISWATNISVVVEACTDIANPVWRSVQTNTLASGASYFSDPQWTNYPGRFYRLRSP
jgi:hypothetical protein